MKSLIKNQTTPSVQKFPCLGIYGDGDIILFTSSREGTTIYNNSGDNQIGTYSDSWVSGWKPFLETIELSND